MRPQRILAGVLCAVLGLLVWSGPVWAASEAAELFEIHCAGCHPGGGNIIRRGKSLTLKALHRNQVDTEIAIADLIANGKNNMSAFSDRLQPTEIDALAHYVLEQAEQGWPA